MIQVIEEQGACELCGSKKNLEAHHIIPIVCGGSDDFDNLLCVCQVCHTKLTPRSRLIKIGMENKRASNAFYGIKILIYQAIEHKLNDREWGSDAIMDAIDEIEPTPQTLRALRGMMIENKWI